jgi:arylsulfatase A-like enzyme
MLTLNIDMAPTMLDLAGLSGRVPMQGKSLAPVIAGGSQKLRSNFFYEHHFPNNGWIPSTEGVRTERWKYSVYTDEPTRTEELYDLEVDMQEETNLVDHDRSRPMLEELRASRQSWLRELDGWRPN